VLQQIPFSVISELAPDLTTARQEAETGVIRDISTVLISGSLFVFLHPVTINTETDITTIRKHHVFFFIFTEV
jgi:hypothetical protein